MTSKPSATRAIPFAEPYDSFVEAVRHRLAAAIVRYEQQAQAAAGSTESKRR